VTVSSPCASPLQEHDASGLHVGRRFALNLAVGRKRHGRYTRSRPAPPREINLEPWRSTNFGASFEYYLNSVSMVNWSCSASTCRASSDGSVTNCNLPDEDAWYATLHCHHRAAAGSGNRSRVRNSTIARDSRSCRHFSNTAWSSTSRSRQQHGQRDLAGNKIPSRTTRPSRELHFVVQDKHFQARVAYNYAQAGLLE